MSDHPDRPADVVTLMWHNDDGTVTTETTDFTVVPKDVTIRIWNNVNPQSLDALAEDSVVIPDGVTL